MQRIDRNNGFIASPWAARIGLLVVGILSGGVVARTALPVAAEAISSAVPRLWAAVQSWLAPPYLFFAVHVIIFVIWKLSEAKQSPRSHWAAAEAETDGVEKTPQAAGEAKAKAVESYHAEPLVRNPSPEFWHVIQHAPEPAAYPPDAEPGGSPPSDASCITTTNSEETSTISPASSGFEIKKTVEPALDTSVVTLAKEASRAETTAAAAPAEDEEEVKVEADEEEVEENASMEATWKAIMENSSRPVVAAAMPHSAVTGGLEPPITIHDEMNKKFEDFIKKHHNQMRIQRHESHQRRSAEMGNRSPISN